MIKQIKDHPLEGELLDAQIKSYGIEHASAVDGISQQSVSRLISGGV